MSIPAELLYAASHEWVRVEGAEAVIGITHFAQDSLGDITFIELPAVGATLAAGQEMGSVESVKAASDIYCPVAGEVIAINEILENAPETVNQDPYGEGWMLRVRLASAPSGLLDAKGYEEIVAKESQ